MHTLRRPEFRLRRVDCESKLRLGELTTERASSVCSPPMRAFRRGLIVLGVAAVAGALMKVRGKGGVPPTNGGWRELEAPDFR